MQKNRLQLLFVVGVAVFVVLLVLTGFLDYKFSKQAQTHLNAIILNGIPAMKELRQITDSSSAAQRAVLNAVLSTSVDRGDAVEKVKFYAEQTTNLLKNVESGKAGGFPSETSHLIESWQAYSESLNELFRLWSQGKIENAEKHRVEVVRKNYDLFKENRNRLWDLKLEFIENHLQMTGVALQRDIDLIKISALVPILASVLLVLFLALCFIWYLIVLPNEGESLPKT